MAKKTTLRLFDSTLGSYQNLELVDSASIYTCGVTPYDASHLGHVATFLYFDVLARLIKAEGLDVKVVRNVTDLDDPLFERMRLTGEKFEDLVQRNVTQLDEDLELLNCMPLSAEPFSSEYIPQMIEAIEKLISKGFAYTKNGWTYFDVAKSNTFPEFKTLKSLSIKDLEEIAFERGATTADPNRRNNLDFVLWKPSADDEPAFDAPFGKGRPGWHIECSVMSMSLLGETIDIHGGGDDLIFPHHACEVAQSEALSGKTFVRQFVHVAPVAYEGEKMSKSLGNLVYADTVIHEIGEMCTRMMLLKHHYREGFEHKEHDAKDAQSRCAKWSENFTDFRGEPVPGEIYEQVKNALKSDLDTPLAMSIIDEATEKLKVDQNNNGMKSDILSAKELLGF